MKATGANASRRRKRERNRDRRKRVNYGLKYADFQTWCEWACGQYPPQPFSIKQFFQARHGRRET